MSDSGTSSADGAGLKLRDLSASASQVSAVIKCVHQYHPANLGLGFCFVYRKTKQTIYFSEETAPRPQLVPELGAALSPIW